MKKFSTIGENVKKTKYELKESLKNEIYSIIDDTLALKISNENKVDTEVDIHGKDELVEKLKTLIDEVRIKERTLTLETVKMNVHRNFDMNWLNEQINGLNKIKIGNEFVLQENINDPASNDQYKAEILNYFVKELNDIKTIGSFEFDYDPSEGIFKFVNENNGIVVKATPFYNEKNGIPIEVFDKNDAENHIFIKQRNFDTEKILFNEYIKIMQNFLTVDYMTEWGDKINPELNDNEE